MIAKLLKDDKVSARHFHSSSDLADEATSTTTLSILLDRELSNLVVLPKKVWWQILDERAKV